MNRRNIIATLTFILALGTASHQSAQTPEAAGGRIAGQVTDANVGGNLAGVQVTIVEIGRTTVAGRDGRFQFGNVPPGTYTVRASYLGYQTVTETVSVAPDRTSQLSFALGGEVVVLEGLVIEGYREGRARALQQKRMASNISEVLSADSMGNLPDQNVAEALNRVAGVSMMGDSGEAKFVSIRGLNPNLNNVTLNGATLASPGIRNQEGRDNISGSSVPLDVIGSAQVSQIEVHKTLTPDMDAAAIGGTINLRTMSAFDQDRRMIFGSVTGGHNDLASRQSFEGNLSFADRFGPEGNWGVALAADFSERPYRVEALQSVALVSNTSQGRFIPFSIELLPEDLRRQRLGLTSNIEYRPNDDSQYYVRFVYNSFDETRERQESVVRATGGGNGVFDGDKTFIFNSARADVDGFFTRIDQTQINFTTGLSRRFGNLTIAPEVTYSYGRETRDIHSDYRFRKGNIQTSGLRIDWSKFILEVDPQNSTIADPNGYNFERATRRDTGAREEIITPRLDIAWELDDFIGRRTVLKSGIKYSTMERSSHDDVQRWSGGGPPLSSIPGAVVTPGQTVQGKSKPFDTDFNAIFNFMSDNTGLFTFNQGASNTQSVQETFDIDQDITAVYGMGTVEFDRLTVIAGVRYERTTATLRGFEHQSLDGSPGPIVRNESDFSFDHVLPNLQARFEINENLLLRAAATWTISRPEYEAAAPASFLSFNTRTDPDEPDFPFSASLVIGNPNLEPYESTNFDISIEYYMNNGSVVSLGGFYKEVDKPIYPIRNQEFFIIRDGLAFNELVTQTFANADKATVKGIEFAAYVPFTFLPAPFDGFGVDANVAFISSEVTIPSRPGEKLPFFEQPDRIISAALFYQKGRFSGRVAYSFQDDSLREITEPGRDFYRARYAQVDAQASYGISDRYTLFASVENLTNQAQNTWTGDPSLMRYSRLTGINIRAGVRFQF